MYYDDPITGKREQRSTKETQVNKAAKVAGKWEDDLRKGRYRRASGMEWSEFRRRYEDEVLVNLADKTNKTVGTVFNTIERILRPKRLRDLTAARLSYFQAELSRGELLDKTNDQRGEKRSPATVRTYMAHLRAALKWAVDMQWFTQPGKLLLR